MIYIIQNNVSKKTKIVFLHTKEKSISSNILEVLKYIIPPLATFTSSNPGDTQTCSVASSIQSSVVSSFDSAKNAFESATGSV